MSGDRGAAYSWIAVATVLLLAVVLTVPVVSGLFAFVTPTPMLLLTGAGLCVGSLVWFEAVKRLSTVHERRG